MTKANIAFVTCNDLPELTLDDQIAARALGALNIEVHPEIWNNPQVKWDSYDALLLRSTWDYYLHYSDFMQWLAKIETLPVQLYNEPNLVRINSNKRYLKDLQTQGIACIETVWLDPPTSESIRSAMQEKKWQTAVLKPAVSAGAFQTTMVHNTQHEPIETRNGSWLLQPMMDEIQTQGEWSLIYIDGSFSHSVLKKPKQNDFRVQEEHGGVTVAASAPIEAQHAAQHLISTIKPTPLYARVDGIMKNTEFKLMEVELIEPSLFFNIVPTAAQTFADAVCKRLFTS